jgi:hypothetical protein
MYTINNLRYPYFFLRTCLSTLGTSLFGILNHLVGSLLAGAEYSIFFDYFVDVIDSWRSKEERTQTYSPTDAENRDERDERIQCDQSPAANASSPLPREIAQQPPRLLSSFAYAMHSSKLLIKIQRARQITVPMSDQSGGSIPVDHFQA